MSEEGGDALLWHPWEFGRGLRNESDPTSLPIAICRYTYYRIFSLILHVDLCLLYRSPTPSPMLSSFCPSIFFNIYSVQSPDSSPPLPFVHLDTNVYYNHLITILCLISFYPFQCNLRYNNCCLLSRFSSILGVLSLRTLVSISCVLFPPISTLLRAAIIFFLPVCLFFSISSNVHDVST